MSKSGKNIKKPLLITAMVLLIAVFITSGTIVIFQTVRNAKEDQAFDDLKKRIGASEPSRKPSDSATEIYIGGGEEDSGEAESPEGAVTEAEEEAPEDEDITGRYDELYAENPDLFGWITIEGTKIDYPVMHTPDNPEYYLHRSFQKKYSSSGVPFLDAKCYIGCGNYLLFGHHMKNGTMFAGLMDYRKEDFWKEHKTVIFDTLEERGVYEIMAAFYSKIYLTTDTDVFRWYNYTDLTDEAVFNEYIAGVEAAKLYDTGITAEFGDELLTLSTCGKDSTQRFVVVAKRVK